MRSRGIQAGDLVIVTKDCCGFYLGVIFTVEKIQFLPADQKVTCRHCKWESEQLTVAWSTLPSPSVMWVSPLSWLRKLEPPDESIAEINRLWEPKRETLKVPR